MLCITLLGGTVIVNERGALFNIHLSGFRFGCEREPNGLRVILRNLRCLTSALNISSYVPECALFILDSQGKPGFDCLGVRSRGDCVLLSILSNVFSFMYSRTLCPQRRSVLAIHLLANRVNPEKLTRNSRLPVCMGDTIVQF